MAARSDMPLHTSVILVRRAVICDESSGCDPRSATYMAAGVFPFGEHLVGDRLIFLNAPLPA